MRVIVCGSRDESSREYVWRGLDEIHRITPLSTIAHGAARGVDSLAETWGNRNKVATIPYKARWKEMGLAAGPMRNQQMLDQFQPDFVIAFAGGRGTADMVRRAEKAGVKVIRVHRESTHKAIFQHSLTEMVKGIK